MEKAKVRKAGYAFKMGAKDSINDMTIGFAVAVGIIQGLTDGSVKSGVLSIIANLGLATVVGGSVSAVTALLQD